VYEYHQRLAAIWQRAARDIESARREFREWCQRAEQSGVRTLREFAKALQGQLPTPA
jgi:stearoyl-CoA desaturase (delta-9 desaturase)